MLKDALNNPWHIWLRENIPQAYSLTQFSRFGSVIVKPSSLEDDVESCEAEAKDHQSMTPTSDGDPRIYNAGVSFKDPLRLSPFISPFLRAAYCVSGENCASSFVLSCSDAKPLPERYTSSLFSYMSTT